MAKHRLYLMATFVLAAVFPVNKYFESSSHFAKGEGPWHSTFLAIYFTLTGLHIMPVLAPHREIARLIKHHFGVGGDTVAALAAEKDDDED